MVRWPLDTRVHVVGDGFQAGVGAATQRIGAQYQRSNKYPTHAVREASGLTQSIGDQRWQVPGLDEQPIYDENKVKNDKPQEYRQQHKDRFLHPPEIQEAQ
jgi:hypothetical protein